MKFYFNPLDRRCKSDLGARPRNSVITFRIYKIGERSGEDFFSAEVCNLIYRRDGERERFYQMRRTDFGWTISLRFNETGLFFYHFRIGEVYLSRGKMRVGETVSSSPESWQITVYDEEFETPEWFKGGVLYQIFPDRFFKSGDLPMPEGRIARNWGEMPYFRPDPLGKIRNNDFFGGNLDGIREKLDYLKRLGVTTIYLNPIFRASSNHRYDTGDYLEIDPLLGDEEAFDRLISAAKRKGIRLILDGVFNHTGADSRYFNKYGNYPSVGAYQSKDSPYADWYQFRIYPDTYECWWGIEILPAVNESSPSYREFLFGDDGVLRHWLRHGIGGYRLDVADELPDSFLKELREAVKEENPEALLLGEVWEDASNKISYGVRREYFRGNELDSVMNYPLKDAIINFLLTGNTSLLRETIAMLIDNYPKTVLDSLMNILGTHDTTRILTVLGGKRCETKEEMAVTFLSPTERAEAIEKLKIAALLQFTLPGVPCVYYGDEIGMEGYQDPFCRRCFEWEKGEKNLTAFYQKLGRLRKSLRGILATGEYREVFADSSCLVFERKSADGAVYVYANRSSGSYTVNFQGTYRELLSGKSFFGTIPGKSYGILQRENE